MKGKENPQILLHSLVVATTKGSMDLFHHQNGSQPVFQNFTKESQQLTTWKV